MIHQMVDFTTKKHLSPTGLTAALQKMGGATALIESYAITVIEQPKLDIPEVPSLEVHDTLARKHANYWLDNLGPQLISVNRDIVDYGVRFNSYYDQMFPWAQKIAQGDMSLVGPFKKALAELDADVTEKGKAADAVLSNLNGFKTNIETDVDNYRADNDLIIQAITGPTGELTILQAEIGELNEELQIAISVIAGGAGIGVLGGVLIVAGVVMLPEGVGWAVLGVGILVAGLGTAAAVGGAVAVGIIWTKLHKKINQERDLNRKVAAFKSVSDQITGLAETGPHAITAVQCLSDGWTNLSVSLNELINQLDNNIDVVSRLLPSEVKTAKAEWVEVIKVADSLQGFGKLEFKTHTIAA